eukprot:1335577-Amphidinium_carterae.1
MLRMSAELWRKVLQHGNLPPVGIFLEQRTIWLNYSNHKYFYFVSAWTPPNFITYLPHGRQRQLCVKTLLTPRDNVLIYNLQHAAGVQFPLSLEHTVLNVVRDMSSDKVQVGEAYAAVVDVLSRCDEVW